MSKKLQMKNFLINFCYHISRPAFLQYNHFSLMCISESRSTCEPNAWTYKIFWHWCRNFNLLLWQTI